MKGNGKWTPHIVAVGAFVVFVVLGLACASTPNSTQSSSAAEKEKQLRQAAERKPKNAKAQYEWGNYLLLTKRDRVQAASVLERALAIDPNYRATAGLNWAPADAAVNGIVVTENIKIDDYSIFLLLGEAYLHGSITGSNRFPEEDRQDALEKALAAYRRGYEIDVTGWKTPSENLDIVYLAYIARTLDNLNRQEEATEMYVKLAKIAKLTTEIASRVDNYEWLNSIKDLPSFYVSASGNDSNNGLSESAPLRSLALAYQRAVDGNIKIITVIGTLNYQSEAAYIDSTDIFNLTASGSASEIIITGKWGAARAVLSGVGSGRNVVYAGGTIRFGYIEISGGELNGESKDGDGIGIYGTVTIGSGTVIRANKGSGIYNRGACTFEGGDINGNENGVYNFGIFVMHSGTIRNNKSTQSGGGVIISSGTFTMSEGSITGNTAESNGGGVVIYSSGTFAMSGGSITGNTAKTDGGGVDNSGTFTMSGGSITGNTVGRDGGGVRNMKTFTMSGGSISNNTARGTGGGVDVSISFGSDTVFTMSSGTISGNKAERGGGVYVSGVIQSVAGSMNGGIFRQSGGSITGNSATAGGGVYVSSYNGRYDKTGGTVSGNTAPRTIVNAVSGYNDANVTREQGSLGSGR